MIGVGVGILFEGTLLPQIMTIMDDIAYHPRAVDAVAPGWITFLRNTNGSFFGETPMRANQRPNDTGLAELRHMKLMHFTVFNPVNRVLQKC